MARKPAPPLAVVERRPAPPAPAAPAAPKNYRVAQTRVGKRSVTLFLDDNLFRAFRGGTILKKTTIQAVFEELANDWCAANGIPIDD